MPAKSISQRNLMGAAYGCKKTGNCSSPKIKKIADSMNANQLRDFASTKNKEIKESKISFKGFMEFLNSSKD